jgi:flavodoxin
MKSKMMVVYYSYSGITKKVAEFIKEKVDGDIFEIEPVDQYPSSYSAVLELANKELASGYKPTLRKRLENMDNYDVIFLGSPVWCGTIAPAVTSFLSTHDLSGKTIIPFCTHGGGGESNTFRDIQILTPRSTVFAGGSFMGNPQKEISTWLEIQLKQKS